MASQNPPQSAVTLPGLGASPPSASFPRLRMPNGEKPPAGETMLASTSPGAMGQGTSQAHASGRTTGQDDLREDLRDGLRDGIRNPARTSSLTDPSVKEAGRPTRDGPEGGQSDLGDESPNAHLQLRGPSRRLPVWLSVAIPIREFRVRNLLGMTSGDVIATQWSQGEDLPLSGGEVQLAWTEFEVADTALAVRITRLA